MIRKFDGMIHKLLRNLSLSIEAIYFSRDVEKKSRATHCSPFGSVICTTSAISWER